MGRRGHGGGGAAAVAQRAARVVDPCVLVPGQVVVGLGIAGACGGPVSSVSGRSGSIHDGVDGGKVVVHDVGW